MWSLFLAVVLTYVCRLAVKLAVTNKGYAAYYVRKFVLQAATYGAIALGGLIEDKYFARDNKIETLPRKPGRVAIVTGGSRGIGAEVVRMLLECEMEVIIACRKVKAGERLLAKIMEPTPDGRVIKGKGRVMKLDNSSLASVEEFATSFESIYGQLDVLVNNAGVMMCPYAETKDGLERHYAVNYMSHFWLTLLLSKCLAMASTVKHRSRVINVTSCAYLLGEINLEDMNRKKFYISGEAYAQSKFAQMLTTMKMARWYEDRRLPISVHAVHPGVVNTQLYQHSFVNFRLFRWLKPLLMRSPKQGATAIVYAAVSPEIEGKTGMYVCHCADWPIDARVRDEKLQNQLYEWSILEIKRIRVDSPQAKLAK